MRRRGPSFASGVGSIFAAIFGVFWTITAATMGAFIMIPFGLLFLVQYTILKVQKIKTLHMMINIIKLNIIILKIDMETKRLNTILM